MSSHGLTLLCLVFQALLFLTDSTSCKNCSETLLSSKWQQMETKIKAQVDAILRQALPIVMRSNSEANISAECQEAIIRVVFGLRQLKGWALRILDATGKPPGGMIEGTLSALGSYPECVNTVAYNDQQETDEMFRGKYCTVLIRPPTYESHFPRKYDVALRLMAEAARKGEILGPYIQRYGFLSRDNAMRLGVCVPSKCLAQDIEQIASTVVKGFDFTAKVRRCDVLEEIRIDNSQKVVIGIISALVLLLILGTTTDTIYNVRACQQEGGPSSKFTRTLKNILVAFSLYSNTKKLTNTKVANHMVSSLNGIRFLSMAWIILGHTYFAGRNSQRFKSLVNGYDILVQNIFAAPIINMTLAVDTFFFISGLLMVLTNWPKMEKNGGKINIFTYLLRRYLRLTPSLAITILLMLLLPLFGSGPFWHETMDRMQENCRQRSWMNFLYINNWVHFKYMCIPETWYLSTNMQLYVIGVIFLIPLFKYPAVGLFSVAILGVLGMCVTAIVTWVYDAPPGMLFLPNYDLLDLVATKVYHKTFTHVGPFCAGILLGYLLVKYKNIFIKMKLQVMGWICSTILCLSVLYGVFDWNRGNMPSAAVSALYAATHRTAWSIGIGWVVYMCATGRGGIVNSFLSWKAFIPLGNISYLGYLVHPLVLYYYLGTLQEIVYYSHYQLVYLFLGHFMIAMMLSTLCYIAVELPFANLERLVFATSKPTDCCKEVEEKAFHPQFISKL